MTLRSTDYALLSQRSYHDPQIASSGPQGVKYQSITLDGVNYVPIAHADNPRNGFQATAYERMDTHEVVIAYRGTEFDREPRQDGLADATMAVNNVNPQIPDALAFTRQVMDLAQHHANVGRFPVKVTVTGHSLGGTLAEVAACEYKLHGATFNAYGAAGLMPNIPEGGSQVIDYVRVTDVVSAASRHYGTVREYATQGDIDVLARHGYHDSAVFNALTPHAPILGKIQGDAHAIDNFVPDSKLLGHSIISPENEKRAQAHHFMIEQYGLEIQAARDVAFFGYQTQKPIIEDVELTVRAGQYLGHAAAKTYDATRTRVVESAHTGERVAYQAFEAARQGVTDGVRATEHVLSQGVEATERSAREAASRAAHDLDTVTSPGKWFGGGPATVPVRLDHPSHPDHALYEQARSGVHQLDAEMHRTPDRRSDNLAAALTVEARRQGLTRIDQVALSENGERAFAMQSGAHSQMVHVQTADAVHASIAYSSVAWAQVTQRAAVPIAQSQAEPAPPHASQAIRQ